MQFSMFLMHNDLDQRRWPIIGYRKEERNNMEYKISVAFAAFIAGLVGVFFTGYMVTGHGQDHIVEVLIAQFIGNGLL